MPRPGQSRERRPDNRHPSHSIEIRTRNLKESADRHGRHPRRFFPSFRCTNHRPSGSAHTVQPRRHENTSPTGKPDYGEKRERYLPTATRRITIGIDSVLHGPPPVPEYLSVCQLRHRKGCAILNRIDSIWHSLLRSFIRRTVKTPASARRTRISTEYKA